MNMKLIFGTDTLVFPSETPEGKSITSVRISGPNKYAAKIFLVGYDKKVKTIVFNSGIQEIKGSEYDFLRFKKVTKVIVPNTVTSIDADAFSCIENRFIISFPSGQNSKLKIPSGKWGATKIEK